MPVSAVRAIWRHVVKQIRRMGGWAYGCYAWVVFVLGMLVFGGLIVLVRKPARARPLVYVATRILFRLAAIPISVRGLEKLPDVPHLLLVNHTSFVDGLVLSALLPPRPGYAFIARQQYSSQALLWPLFSTLGMIVLRPATPAHMSSNVVVLCDALRQGERLIVFPEGGFVPEPGLRTFHTGAFVAAATENVPLVVAALRGSRQVLKPRSWLPRRAPLALEIGPVFVPEGKDMQSILRLCKAAHDAMVPLTGERDVDERDAGEGRAGDGRSGEIRAGDRDAGN